MEDDLRIKSVHLKGYKRFKDLRIQDIPEEAKLVVLMGPNGIGKSCIFDAFLLKSRPPGRNYMLEGERSNYYPHEPEDIRGIRTTDDVREKIDVEFHGFTPSDDDWPELFHIRSPYRNQPDLEESTISRPNDVTKQQRFERIIDADNAVSENFSRLMFVRDEFIERKGSRHTNLGSYRDNFIKKLQKPMRRLFKDQGFKLQGFGGLQNGGTFRFDKGLRQNVHYKNLSGGEKASLDLLLDLFVHRNLLTRAIYCIDEPEAHIATALHGQLLLELLKLVPKHSQLWVATHSIGIMRQAYDMKLKDDGSIVFIDFTGEDLDRQATLVPRPPDRSFWRSAYRVALDDVSELIAPRRIVLCEGRRDHVDKGFDAACYNDMFAEMRSDTLFISRGGSAQVESSDDLIAVLGAVAQGVDVVKLIDRDAMTDGNRDRKMDVGIKVLGRHELENYLFDIEVIKTYLKMNDKEDCANAIYENHKVLFDDEDFKIRDIKGEIGAIFKTIEDVTELRKQGKGKYEFARFNLVPALTKTPEVFDELRKHVFGSE